MARQKRSREPTKDEWDDAIDAIRLLDNLDRAEFRKEVEKLARELEREGLAAHRVACIVRAVHEFGIDGDLGGTARTPTAPTLTPVQP